MMDCFNGFVDTMLEEKDKFKSIQSETDMKKEEVRIMIEDLNAREQSAFSAIESEISKAQDESMKEIFDKASECLYQTMMEANNKICEAVDGMEFIQKFEKQFTVFVFGSVKAGKSYLGNLILGHPIQEAGISSSYDKLGDRIVHVQDRGKLYDQKKLSTEMEEKECNGEEFYVNAQEATSTIQWADIGGMCWFDTPGTGSVTPENEELAEKYIKNADLVIFTCNSDAAGTEPELSELRQLHDMKKPILLLLTQSDTLDYDVDEDGEVINTLVPKSDKDRLDQENYVRDCLKKYNMEDVLKYADILSVSAMLAKEAIYSGDETMFDQSNIGILLDKLTSITKNEAADIKRSTPKNRINTMIDGVICDLKTIAEEISRYCLEIENGKRALEERKEWIIEQIKADLNTKVAAIVYEAKNEVEQGSDKVVGEAELADRINQAVIETVQKVCVEEAIAQNKNVPDLEVKLTGLGDMRMKQDRIAYQYSYVHKEQRDPQSVFEKIGHKLFHKQYYTYDSKSETRYSTFDVGVNDSEIAQNIVLQLAVAFPETVEQYVGCLVKGYYDPIEKMKTQAEKEIKTTISKMEELRM